MNKESQDRLFETARQNMETLLAGFPLAIDSWSKKEYAFAIKKNNPVIIARGLNALVLQLPPVEIDGKTRHMVGKVFKYTQTSNYDVPKDEFHMVGCNSGLTMDIYGLDTTLYWLNRMKLGITIPPMREYHKMFSKKYFHFTIMPDLREDGRYSVRDAGDGQFTRLNNGEELKREFNNACANILEQIARGGLAIVTAGHGSEEEPMPAIEHMFLIQERDKKGRLVIADLNHLAIHENTHQYGTKPKYLA